MTTEKIEKPKTTKIKNKNIKLEYAVLEYFHGDAGLEEGLNVYGDMGFDIAQIITTNVSAKIILVREKK